MSNREAREVMDGPVQRRTREATHESWVRRHALVLGVAAFGVLSFAAFTWAERGYYCDQAAAHHQPCGGFWTAGHMHDLVYNCLSNWQSEALIGILLLVALLKLEGEEGADT